MFSDMKLLLMLQFISYHRNIILDNFDYFTMTKLPLYWVCHVAFEAMKQCLSNVVIHLLSSDCKISNPMISVKKRLHIAMLISPLQCILLKTEKTF